jgi:hypothetical protein
MHLLAISEVLNDNDYVCMPFCVFVDGLVVDTNLAEEEGGS